MSATVIRFRWQVSTSVSAPTSCGLHLVAGGESEEVKIPVVGQVFQRVFGLLRPVFTPSAVFSRHYTVGQLAVIHVKEDSCEEERPPSNRHHTAIALNYCDSTTVVRININSIIQELLWPSAH